MGSIKAVHLFSSYGLELTNGDFGYVKCKITGVGAPFATNASVLIDPPFGRTYVKPPARHLSADGELYMYQTYAGRFISCIAFISTKNHVIGREKKGFSELFSILPRSAATYRKQFICSTQNLQKTFFFPKQKFSDKCVDLGSYLLNYLISVEVGSLL